VKRRIPWFMSPRPDVLGLLQRHAEAMQRGLEALARWSSEGSETDVQAIREAEHEGDALRRELIEQLTTALTTPIEQEHAYALSERIDEVLNSVKDVVRIARALDWRPDGAAAGMARCAEEAGRDLLAAIGKIGVRDAHPGDDADRAIKAARRVEHELLAGLDALRSDADPRYLQATLEVYRRYEAVGSSLLRAADRLLYAILRLV